MDRTETLRALPRLLLAWYAENKRDLPWRENTDPYRVWVSEIMLQQTRVEAAKERYRLFMQELPTLSALASCSEEKLLKLWEGLGYYSRAKNMQKAAKELIRLGGFPSSAKELAALPGTGEYTAGAIASISFGEPAPAVDGNVVRVLARILGDREEQDVLKKRYFFELAPVYPQGRCGDFTQSLMELGALVCLPASPKCAACPVAALCREKGDALPVKRRKPARRVLPVSVFVFYGKDGVWLEKRKDGVLAGMMQFFCLEKELTKADAAAFLAGAGLSSFSLGGAQKHKHVFTHLVWEMTAYPVFTQEDLSRLPAFSALRFYGATKARNEISLPSAFRWCLSLLPAGL